MPDLNSKFGYNLTLTIQTLTPNKIPNMQHASKNTLSLRGDLQNVPMSLCVPKARMCVHKYVPTSIAR